jgi:single-stranded-DNA-specific exonuclease
MKKWDVKHILDDNDVLLDVLLSDRGLDTEEDQKKFLNPHPILTILKNLPEDFKENTKKAAELVKMTIGEGKPIVIHGDYDADGICATAILQKIIRSELDYDKSFAFIPNRFDHGYGVTEASIDAIVVSIKKNEESVEGALLITVDAGITAVDAIAYAKKKGFNVIVTDHHQKPNQLPPADLIVWNDEVVGAGVAWILGRILGSKNPQLLAFAALATVTDLQPLTSYNRSIVKEGLEIFNSNPPLGLKLLREVAGKKGEVTTYDLGWVLGPRINATGRISNADEALLLLLEEDEEKAREHAVYLNQINATRQDKTLEMYALSQDLDPEDLPRIIVSSNKDYHEGIIGLVAAKLKQTHNRPAIVMSIDGDYAKGSVRSVIGVDIIKLLREFEDIFESVGGHPMAAGFTLHTDKFDEFNKNITKYAEKYVLDEHLVPVLSIDAQVPLDIVDIDFVKSIARLKPFGVGNKEPVFMSEKVSVTNVNTVGRDGTHISLKLGTDGVGGRGHKAIFFGGAEHEVACNIAFGDIIDVAYTARENEFNGRRYVDLMVKDVKFSS